MLCFTKYAESMGLPDGLRVLYRQKLAMQASVYPLETRMPLQQQTPNQPAGVCS